MYVRISKTLHVMITAASPGGINYNYITVFFTVMPYMSCPCHVEMILQEKEETVEKAPEEVKPKRFTKKQIAKRRLRVGGGV